MTKVWIYDIQSCPINKRVHFLCGFNGVPQYEIVGTLTTNPYNGTIIRGECLEGDPNIFYKTELIAWGRYVPNREVESIYE